MTRHFPKASKRSRTVAELIKFGDETSGMFLDNSHRFRYHLWRLWDEQAPRLCFIMLNPSTADHKKNDPTIARCVSFARDWHYGSLDVINLFAWRATDSSSLRKVKDPVGPLNDQIIMNVCERADSIVVAWGNHGALYERHMQVLELIPRRLKPLCFGVTDRGQPRHPLYVAGATPLSAFDPFNQFNPRRL
jgi:hypothetical protein